MTLDGARITRWVDFPLMSESHNLADPQRDPAAGRSGNPIGWSMVVGAVGALLLWLRGYRLHPETNDILNSIFVVAVSVIVLLVGLNVLIGHRGPKSTGDQNEGARTSRREPSRTSRRPQGFMKALAYCGVGMFLSGLVLQQSFLYTRPEHPDVGRGRTVALHQRGSTTYLTESENALLKVLIWGGFSLFAVVGLLHRRDD